MTVEQQLSCSFGTTGKAYESGRASQRSGRTGYNVMFLLDAESEFVVKMQLVCIVNSEPVQS